MKLGKDPPPMAPFADVATDPPDGVRVPLSELPVATVPADPVENEITKALDTGEIVIDPAEAAEPLWIDLITLVD